MKSAKMLTILVLALGLIIWQAEVRGEELANPTISYQGRLMDAGVPAHGLYDLEFKLYDSAEPCEANQVGATVFCSDVAAVEGYINCDMIWDPCIFSTHEVLYVEARVEGIYMDQTVAIWPDPYWHCNKPGPTNITGSGTNGYIAKFTGTYTIGNTGTPIYESGSNIAIGHTSPSQKLDVSGNVTANMYYDRNNSSYYLDPASTGTSLVVAGDVKFPGLTSGVGQNYRLVLVNTSTGKLYYGGISSSKRYKTRIRELQVNPDMVLQLTPVRFQWKETGTEDIGLIAEEVDDLVRDLVIYDEAGRPDGVRYDKVALHLLAVVKEQQERIAALEAKLAENESLRQRLEALEKAVEEYEFAGVKEVQ